MHPDYFSERINAMFLIITNQIFKMLLLLLVGCVCYRLKLVDQNGNKMLANLLLMVVNPMLAIMSMQTDYNPQLVRGLLLSYGLAIATHIIIIVFSRLVIRDRLDQNYAIDRFSMIYANCGFMGIPLVQSILGSEGVLYLTAYMVVFNIFSWTQGVGLMTGSTSFQEFKKALLSPMIIASVLGLVLFFLRIRLPGVVADTMNYISSMNTPLAMMIAGISVAQTDIPSMLRNKRIYLISACKLLVMPAIVLVMLAILHADPTVSCVTLVAAACPCAATGTAFALRFHKDYKYASELYAFTTVVSLATIPLWVKAAELLLM